MRNQQSALWFEIALKPELRRQWVADTFQLACRLADLSPGPRLAATDARPIMYHGVSTSLLHKKIQKKMQVIFCQCVLFPNNQIWMSLLWLNMSNIGHDSVLESYQDGVSVPQGGPCRCWRWVARSVVQHGVYESCLLHWVHFVIMSFLIIKWWVLLRMSNFVSVEGYRWLIFFPLGLAATHAGLLDHLSTMESQNLSWGSCGSMS